MTFGLDNCRRKRRKREEVTLQEALVRDLPSLLSPCVEFFAYPAGGSRHVVEAVNLKRQGVKAGIPDLLFLYAGKIFGLELKSKTGVLGDSQKEMFPRLRNAGMRIEVARNQSEALDHLRDMGIPLRIVEETKWDVQNIFKQETRRRA